MPKTTAPTAAEMPSATDSDRLRKVLSGTIGVRVSSFIDDETGQEDRGGGERADCLHRCPRVCVRPDNGADERRRSQRQRDGASDIQLAACVLAGRLGQCESGDSEERQDRSAEALRGAGRDQHPCLLGETAEQAAHGEAGQASVSRHGGLSWPHGRVVAGKMSASARHSGIVPSPDGYRTILV
jgi:hypothetical protein